MNKYMSIDKQISHLINSKKINIENKKVVETFLYKNPYEQSIKEIKPFLKDYDMKNKKAFYNKEWEWEEVTEIYNVTREKSLKLLGNLIDVESMFKSIIIYELFEVDNHLEYEYKSGYSFDREKKYLRKKYDISDDLDELKKYLKTNKYYIIINRMSFKEIISFLCKEIKLKDLELFESIINKVLQENDDLKNEFYEIKRKHKIKDEYKKNVLEAKYKELFNIEDISNEEYLKIEKIVIKRHFVGEINKYFKKLASDKDLKIKKVFDYENFKKQTKIELNKKIFFDEIHNDSKYEFKQIIEEIKNNGELSKNSKDKLDKNIDEFVKWLHKDYIINNITLTLHKEYLQKDILLVKEIDSSYKKELKKSEYKEMEKYLYILADIRNTIAHGNTFVLELIQVHESALKEIFITQRLSDYEYKKKLLNVKKFYKKSKK